MGEKNKVITSLACMFFACLSVLFTYEVIVPRGGVILFGLPPDFIIFVIVGGLIGAL
jgi:hypothetical protein